MTTTAYSCVLSQVFLHHVVERPDAVREMVALLLDATRTDAPHGSSFSVTVARFDGSWDLWLSAASFRFLQAKSGFALVSEDDEPVGQG